MIPTALIDFGLRTSGGIYFFYDDFLTKNNQLRVNAATGGRDWLRLTVADRIPVDNHAHVKLRFEASTRPDQLFYGIGPRSLERSHSIYALTAYDGSALFHLEPAPYLLVEAQAGVRSMKFGALPTAARRQSSCARPSTARPSPTSARLHGRAPEPLRGPRLAQAAPRSRDGHPLRRQPGARLRSARPRAEPLDQVRRRVGGYLDLDGNNRVLSLSLTTRFVDPTGPAELPFTELVALGGDQVLFGYLRTG